MGEVFGDCGLKEFISVDNYLNSSFLIDEFLEGMAKGMKKAANRKALELKRLKSKNKGNKSTLHLDDLNLGDIE